jgi:hypothetical protein
LTARSVGVVLPYIRPGLTDEFQPLDRPVFGVLKAQAKRLFQDRFHTNSDSRRTKQEAFTDVLTACPLLGESAVEHAWDIYIQRTPDFSFSYCCVLIVDVPASRRKQDCIPLNSYLSSKVPSKTRRMDPRSYYGKAKVTLIHLIKTLLRVQNHQELQKNLFNKEKFCISSSPSGSNLSYCTYQLDKTLSSMRCRL